MIDPRDKLELTKTLAVLTYLAETLEGEDALKLYRAIGEKRGFLERRLRREGAFAIEKARNEANRVIVAPVEN